MLLRFSELKIYLPGSSHAWPAKSSMSRIEWWQLSHSNSVGLEHSENGVLFHYLISDIFGVFKLYGGHPWYKNFDTFDDKWNENL